MLGLGAYGSDSEEEAAPEPVDSAPQIDLVQTNMIVPYADPTKAVVKYNLPVEQMHASIVGPISGHESREDHFRPAANNPAGHVSKTHIDGFMFDQQYHSMLNARPGLDPATFLEGKPRKQIGHTQSTQNDVFLSSKGADKKARKRGKKRKRRGDPSDLNNWLGPWAPPKKSEADLEEEEALTQILKKNKREWEEAHPEEDALNELEDPDGADAPLARKIRRNKEERKHESSEFHLDEEEDYLGRTYMYCPPEHLPDVSDDKKCYIPKTLLHTWSGHTHGVNAIQFIPKTGHILLSCSMDATIKLWDVMNHRKCIRTCSGHERGVRNIYFNNDGSRFISTGYDKWIKIWDTETGKVVSRHSSGKMGFDAKFYPKDENEFLCGQTNKIAVQWDIRADEIVQTYDDHLGPVNTVTFIDENRRFASTSDDKKILIWDYGTPVVCKHISEPHLHSVPFMSVHPSGKWMVGQSMDNTLVVYAATGRFGQHGKKKFTGHINAGYACEVSFSPDGKFVMSGDANGRIFFWDWLTSRVYKRLNAHSKVAMGAKWHPLHPSRVATCSWDGTIKFWD